MADKISVTECLRYLEVSLYIVTKIKYFMFLNEFITTRVHIQILYGVICFYRDFTVLGVYNLLFE